MCEDVPVHGYGRRRSDAHSKTLTRRSRISANQSARAKTINAGAIGRRAVPLVGLALAGWLTDKIGPVQVFILGGSSTVALALLAYLHPGVRRVD